MESFSKNKLRVLITGATGLLGREVFAFFSAQANHIVTGLGFNRAVAPLKKLDLTSEKSVADFFSENLFDLIIHCAAERDPGVCETDFKKTDAMNIETTAKLISIANKQAARLFFISTDYVFDGSKAPYKENSAKNPLNYYGASKSKAEDLVTEKAKKYIILRVPVLYGPTRALSESAVTKIAQQVIDKKNLQFDHWAIRSPTLTTDIAQAIYTMVTTSTNHLSEKEILHFSSPEQLTKYQMAKIIAEILGINSETYIALLNPTDDAPRPKDCTLDTNKIKQILTRPTTSFKQNISNILASLK